MQILENYDLTQFNTFGIKVRAKYFVEINTILDLSSLILENIFKKKLIFTNFISKKFILNNF
jgi:UDP-N-acetylenolpyruvoylglucosamine reductase